MQVEGSTFLVTGGSSGLGGATVRMLAERGAKVVIADINREDGEGFVAELGGRVRFALTDVTSEPQVQASIETALDFGGNLRGVIHCAGIVTPRRVLDKDGIVHHPLDLFAKGIQV